MVTTGKKAPLGKGSGVKNRRKIQKDSLQTRQKEKTKTLERNWVSARRIKKDKRSKEKKKMGGPTGQEKAIRSGDATRGRLQKEKREVLVGSQKATLEVKTKKKNNAKKQKKHRENGAEVGKGKNGSGKYFHLRKTLKTRLFLWVSGTITRNIWGGKGIQQRAERTNREWMDYWTLKYKKSNPIKRPCQFSKQQERTKVPKGKRGKKKGGKRGPSVH